MLTTRTWIIRRSGVISRCSTLPASAAFGTVYRAWDAQLEREVALKLLAVSPDRSPLTEAQHLARIRHPNVVTVYGAEQDRPAGRHLDGVHRGRNAGRERWRSVGR